IEHRRSEPSELPVEGHDAIRRRHYIACRVVAVDKRLREPGQFTSDGLVVLQPARHRPIGMRGRVRAAGMEPELVVADEREVAESGRAPLESSEPAGRTLPDAQLAAVLQTQALDGFNH